MLANFGMASPVFLLLHFAALRDKRVDGALRIGDLVFRYIPGRGVVFIYFVLSRLMMVRVEYSYPEKLLSVCFVFRFPIFFGTMVSCLGLR